MSVYVDAFFAPSPKGVDHVMQFADPESTVAHVGDVDAFARFFSDTHIDTLTVITN